MKREPSAAVVGAHGRCANCGAALAGRYCSDCGQEDRDPARTSLRELLHEWLGGIFSFDSRLLRTLGPLVSRPGFLTLEYLGGRRAPYVPPLRLFLFTSVVAFLLLGLSGAIFVNKSVTTDPAPADPAVVDRAEPSVWQRFGDADIGELNDIFVRRAPQAFFLLAPVLGLLLWVVYKGREPFYVPHLVLSLHFHTLTFLAVTVATYVDLAFEGQPAARVMPPILAVHFYLASRRIYGRGRLATAVVTFAVLLFYSVLWLIATLGLMLLTLALG